MHEEFTHTAVHFDVVRRDAGLLGFGGPFDRRTAGYATALTARLDVRGALARKLGRSPAWLDVLAPKGG